MDVISNTDGSGYICIHPCHSTLFGSRPRALPLRSRNFRQLAAGYQIAKYNPKMGARKGNRKLGSILKASPV